MKITVLLLCLTVTVSLLVGCDRNKNSSIQSKSNKEENRKLCYSIGETSEKIMYARQNGVPMSELLKKLDALTKQNSNALPETISLSESLITDAYKVPRYETEEGKRDAIENFQNSALSECIKAFSNNK